MQNLDGVVINPGNLIAVIPTMHLSPNGDGYRITFKTYNEVEFLGKTLYDTEEECQKAICKLMELGDDNVFEDIANKIDEIEQRVYSLENNEAERLYKEEYEDWLEDLDETN